jgi:hypothetical protein
VCEFGGEHQLGVSLSLAYRLRRWSVSKLRCLPQVSCIIAANSGTREIRRSIQNGKDEE